MGDRRCFTDRTITVRTMKGIARLGLFAALLVTGLLVAAPTAQAISYDFTADFCTGGCGTAPFSSVTLTQNGSIVDVVAHLNDPNSWIKTGAGDSQSFLFNGIDIALADITIDPHTPALVAATGSFHASASGDWAFGIGCPTCKNGGAGIFTGDILFHIANASISELIRPNANSHNSTAHTLDRNRNTPTTTTPH